MATRAFDKRLAGDTIAGGLAVIVSWAARELGGLNISILEAGAFIVVTQSGAHWIIKRIEEGRQ